MVGLSGNNTGSVTEGTGSVTVSTSDVIINTESTGAPFSWAPGGYDIITGPAIGTLTAVQDTAGGEGSVTWVYSIDSDDPALDGLDTGDSIDVTFTIRVTDISYSGSYILSSGTVVAETFEVTITINGRSEVCFTRGTEIMTPSGPCLIENLCVGDLVETRDNGAQPVKWIASAKISDQYRRGNDALEPIVIKADALEPGVPAQDLKVSPQHRILLTGGNYDLLFGEPAVLASAKNLVNGHSIYACGDDFEELEYWHMMLGDHQIVFANGCPSESFYFGDMAQGMMNDAQVAELYALFPQFKTEGPPLAYPQLSAHEAAVLTRGGAQADPVQPREVSETAYSRA